MDKYGFYIISAYGVVGFVLCVLVLREFFTYRALTKELDELKE